ncbi:spore protease YyaC [Sedimentibacter sp. MB31-C6]|uniref:spore protease YyaC n=1 Tax=Sedimentibacter sp. MB31-C6 TaxID=3109366 RepID=UPI002DDD1566|nr:spore protease YyaC [Sedimentibacter sp. MB36-C1]WSI02944.1 spore protease YyaC [Sedimentibacter sp. MB36-C1]
MNPIEVHYKNNFANIKIGHYLSEYLNQHTAIICIGTDKCIIDSLGPLIGTMLVKKNISVDVFGTLDKPVHALNLNENIKTIKNKKYNNVLAIDACLSNKKKQGIIEVRHGPINPGKGIGKYLPEIGDVSIIGIVDSSEKEFNDLVQDTRLSLIYEMAEVISEGILTAFNMNNNIGEYLCDQASLSRT